MTSEQTGRTISLRTINDEQVIPLPVGRPFDNRPILGEQLFPELFANVALIARKKMGKTCVLQTMIKRCCGPRTCVLAFCTTVQKDQNWKSIRKWCEKHNIKFEGFTSIKQGKINILDKFLERLEREAEEDLVEEENDEQEEKIPERNRVEGGRKRNLDLFENEEGDEDGYDSFDENCGQDSEEEKEEFNYNQRVPTASEQRMFSNRNTTSLQPREPFQSPEYIIIFDDISLELKSPSVSALLKKNRHYKLKVFLSSQNLKDLRPESLRQIEYFILFKGLTDELIKKVCDDADLAIDLETLIKLYHDATIEDYSFLYVDVRSDLYRKKFDKMYIIN